MNGINSIVELFIAIMVLLLALSFASAEMQKRKIRDLANNAIEMTPKEFFNLRNRNRGKNKRLSTIYDFEGVYILYNQTKKLYYVGQGKKVMNRINQHFTGHGNGDVYADYKYGDAFTIRAIKLEGSGFSTLNALEKSTITSYNAFSKGYNKTRGNRG